MKILYVGPGMVIDKILAVSKRIFLILKQIFLDMIDILKYLIYWKNIEVKWMQFFLQVSRHLNF